MDFNKKGNSEFFNNTLLFKTLGIIFLVVILALFLADFKIYQKKQQLISQINAYQKQIKDIEKNSQNLKDEIANSNNTDYLEKLGYEQFNETKPGEKEIIFTSPQEKPKEAAKPQNFWDIKLWSDWLVGGLNWIKSKL
jgi:cell division protein FtsB